LKRFSVVFLVLVLATGGSPSVSGYEFIGSVWDSAQMPVPYCVNPWDIPVGSYGEPILSWDEWAGMVQWAFQTWEDASNGHISFDFQGFCDNDPFDNRDGVNTVGWGWLWGTAVGLDDPSSTNGQFLRNEAFGQIFESDIVIDQRFAQSFDDVRPYIDLVLPHVLLHETGHFAGLDHSRDDCSIMAAFIGPLESITTALCEDDYWGINLLYP
jgi:hypothetical protein